MRSYYPDKLAKWMEFFPRQQLHILQVGGLRVACCAWQHQEAQQPCFWRQVCSLRLLCPISCLPHCLGAVQFENMTSPESMGGVMQELKGFLGLDPRLPSNQLPLTNYKHQRASRNAVSELPAVLAELWDRLLACRTAGCTGACIKGQRGCCKAGGPPQQQPTHGACSTPAV